MENVKHDVLKHSFSIDVEGKTAFAVYAVDNNIFDILTTQVPKELSGRGIAGLLMSKAYEFCRQQGFSAKENASCSYAAAWLKKHQH